MVATTKSRTAALIAIRRRRQEHDVLVLGRVIEYVDNHHWVKRIVQKNPILWELRLQPTLLDVCRHLDQVGIPTPRRTGSWGYKTLGRILHRYSVVGSSGYWWKGRFKGGWKIPRAVRDRYSKQ